MKITKVLKNLTKFKKSTNSQAIMSDLCRICDQWQKRAKARDWNLFFNDISFGQKLDFLDLSVAQTRI